MQPEVIPLRAKNENQTTFFGKKSRLEEKFSLQASFKKFYCIFTDKTRVFKLFSASYFEKQFILL